MEAEAAVEVWLCVLGWVVSFVS